MLQIQLTQKGRVQGKGRDRQTDRETYTSPLEPAA